MATPSADQMEKGLAVMAERKGEFEPAEVVQESKKKAGHWAVRFQSDGKLFPRPLDQLRLPINQFAEEEEEEEEENVKVSSEEPEKNSSDQSDDAEDDDNAEDDDDDDDAEDDDDDDAAEDDGAEDDADDADDAEDDDEDEDEYSGSSKKVGVLEEIKELLDSTAVMTDELFDTVFATLQEVAAPVVIGAKRKPGSEFAAAPAKKVKKYVHEGEEEVIETLVCIEAECREEFPFFKVSLIASSNPFDGLNN